MNIDAQKGLQRMAGWTSYLPPGMCLEAVWKAYGSIPSTGPHAGQYPYALRGWQFATQKHPGNRNVPAGAPVYFTAGGNGYGHVAISAGGDQVISTDIPSAGRVGRTTIQAIEARWGRSYLGYTTDFLGHQLVNLGAVNAGPIPPQGASTNPFGIPDIRGLQKIARMYGGLTQLDNRWGPLTERGFVTFLQRNGYWSGALVPSTANWLRRRWGYVGNDVIGPVYRGALMRANDGNFREL